VAARRAPTRRPDPLGRTDPWETGFVDIAGDQALLGQVDGRTRAAVQAWLTARTEEFRAGIEVVVIDPHAGDTAAVRAALPDAQVAVDHFHLIMLGNKPSPAVCSIAAAAQPTRRGPTGGCCCAGASGSPRLDFRRCWAHDCDRLQH
jgi:hypothetical protein